MQKVESNSQMEETRIILYVQGSTNSTAQARNSSGVSTLKSETLESCNPGISVTSKALSPLSPEP
jgi:hypothetical protein